MPTNGYNSNAENRARGRELEGWKALRSAEAALHRVELQVASSPPEALPFAAKQYGLTNKQDRLANAMARSTQYNIQKAITPGIVQKLGSKFSRTPSPTVGPNNKRRTLRRRRNELGRILSRQNITERAKRATRKDLRNIEKELQTIEKDILIKQAYDKFSQNSRYTKFFTRRDELLRLINSRNVSAADRRKYSAELEVREREIMALT